MVSEFEVIRMLLDIQGAPAEPPAEMLVETKDSIIGRSIREMLDRAENAQKPAECARKPAEMAQTSAAEAEKPAKKAGPPLIREKEMLQAKITQPPSGGGSNRNSTKGRWLRFAGPGGRSKPSRKK